MGSASGSGKRLLYLGTDNGLARLRLGGGAEPSVETRGLWGLRVSSVLVDNDVPERIYVGTHNDGFYRSDDAGETWRELNKGILYKDIWSLAQHPKTAELYAGTLPPAVFKSSNGGESWVSCTSLQQIEDSIHWTSPKPPHIARIRDIALVHGEPSRIYAAVEDGWVLRSQDSGRSWETLKQGVAFEAHAVTILPDDPNTILVTSASGAYRSDNGGDKFVRSDKGILAGLSKGAYLSRAVVHAARPDVLFVAGAEVPPSFWMARAQGANTFFYRSDDRGKSWRKLAGRGLRLPMQPGPLSCMMDPEEPGVVYFGMSDGSLWGSEDGGESFSVLVDGLSGGVSSVAVVPLSAISSFQRPAPSSASVGELRMGEVYEVTIQNEIDNPFIGLNGVGRLGDCDVCIPHAKKGERYTVRLVSVGRNSFTGRKEATVQKLSGPD